jgi:hypothetical protein
LLAPIVKGFGSASVLGPSENRAAAALTAQAGITAAAQGGPAWRLGCRSGCQGGLRGEEGFGLQGV